MKEMKQGGETRLYGMSLSLPEQVVKENLDVIMDAMLDN